MELLKRVKDQEIDSNKQKADKTVESVKIEFLEETLQKLRSELKSALQVSVFRRFWSMRLSCGNASAYAHTHSHSKICTCELNVGSRHNRRASD
jgi:Ni,Fe-hydrogenase III component G